MRWLQLRCAAARIALNSNSNPWCGREQVEWMMSVWRECWAHNSTKRPTMWRYEPPRAELEALAPEPYYLVPFTIWHPVRVFAGLVPYMPCPQTDQKTNLPCLQKTTLKSFNSPRWIIGLSRSELLWSSAHFCPLHKGFSSSDEASIEKLPSFVKATFPFVLSSRSAVTRE